jgi:gas vesicle protein
MKFIIGLSIGVVIGMVYAPASGEETRRKLRERIEDAGISPRQAALRMTDEAEKKAGNLGERIGRRVGEATLEAIRDEISEGNKRTA